MIQIYNNITIQTNKMYNNLIHLCRIAIIMYICSMEKQTLNRIKAVLAEKDVNQLYLSKELGKGRVTVNRYCNNEKQPSLGTLKKISTILGVTMCSLIVED